MAIDWMTPSGSPAPANPSANAPAPLSASFRTIPVVNTRIPKYTLTIRSPHPPYAAVNSYTFPMSPQSITKRFTSLANIYDVKGTQDQQGVQRVVDWYGNAPVFYELNGTTGWQRHSADRYQTTGLESVLQIQALLAQYAKLNSGQAQAGQPLYKLEFYDYWTPEFWEVIPYGDQTLSQDERQPLLVHYSFRLAGIQLVGASTPDPPPDPIKTDFAQPAPQAQKQVTKTASNLLADELSRTPAGVAILNDQFAADLVRANSLVPK